MTFNLYIDGVMKELQVGVVEDLRLMDNGKRVEGTLLIGFCVANLKFEKIGRSAWQIM